jgi:hypothetical protein
MGQLSCPQWCVADHRRGDTSKGKGKVGLHYSATRDVAMSISASPLSHERFEVGVVCGDYELADRTRSMQAVELAHHLKGRYSVVALTPNEARALARLLVEAADQCANDGVTAVVDVVRPLPRR